MIRRGVPIEMVARLLTRPVLHDHEPDQTYVHLGAADIREALLRAGVWPEEEGR